MTFFRMETVHAEVASLPLYHTSRDSQLHNLYQNHVIANA